MSRAQIPILISAPHGAKHYRRGDGKGHWKKEDAYTSSLAIALGQLTGAHVLYAKYKAGEDPNSDPACGYKDFLRKAVHEHNIRFVIDLHGAGSSQPFKIDVGTITDFPEECSCPTFRPIIEKALQGFEEHAFNKHFSGRRLRNDHFLCEKRPQYRGSAVRDQCPLQDRGEQIKSRH